MKEGKKKKTQTRARQSFRFKNTKLIRIFTIDRTNGIALRMMYDASCPRAKLYFFRVLQQCIHVCRCEKYYINVRWYYVGIVCAQLFSEWLCVAFFCGYEHEQHLFTFEIKSKNVEYVNKRKKTKN